MGLCLFFDTVAIIDNDMKVSKLLFVYQKLLNNSCDPSMNLKRWSFSSFFVTGRYANVLRLYSALPLNVN